ncbi:MAG: hypothetical protein ABW252_19270 [Polyangiales bacterium]
MPHLSSGSLGSSLLALFMFAVSCAAPQPAASQALRARASAYALEVLVDGAPVRTFEHGGQTYVLGSEGRRYVLRVHNRSARRIEAVITVDGLDVMDGQPGAFEKRGYLVPAYGHVDIDGWRLNMAEAAAFRFAPIGQSYAAKTGRARNVGVIGVAVFPERVVPAPRVARPAPSDGELSREGLGGAPKGEMEARAEAAPLPAPASTGAAPAEDKASADEATASRGGAAKRRTRSGLGTEFGEAVSSHIQEVAFTRAQATRPSALLGVRYDDRAGLLAVGIDVDGLSDRALRATASPFPAAPRSFAPPPADWRRD